MDKQHNRQMILILMQELNLGLVGYSKLNSKGQRIHKQFPQPLTVEQVKGMLK